MTTIEQQLNQVRLRIVNACHACGRDPAGVQLLAVSKTVHADLVAQAADAGQTRFGENYVQEGVDKMRALANLPLEWHCIGPVQSNKTRLVAENFAWMHTIDRLKIAQRLSEQRPARLPALQVCIQVNIDGGLNKAGVAPDQAWPLAREVAQLPGLTLRGIMTLPEPDGLGAGVTVPSAHRSARQLFDQLRGQGLALDTLSMGMSQDLESAIAAGSTLVRVGSALFGARNAVAQR